MLRKDPESEINYSIQNLKGSENESKKSTMHTVKIVKKNARRNKRAFADQIAKEVEETANKRDMGALHKITRRLCGVRQKCSTVARNRAGRILTTDREQSASWVEHFKSVLNQPCPLNTAISSPSSKDLDSAWHTDG